MIRINLLEEGEKPKKAKKVREAPVVAMKPQMVSQYIIVATIILALVPLFIGYKKYSKVREVVKNVEDAKVKKANLEKDVKKLQEKSKDIKAIISTLRNQVEVIDRLAPGEKGIFWSEKLDYLSDLIPKDIYILNAKITEKVNQVETEESKKAREDWLKNKKQGKEPKKQTRPVIEQRLILTCIADAEEREDRIRLMTSFQDAMKNHKAIRKGKIRRFMDNLTDSIYISGIRTVDSYGKECGQFNLTLISESS